MVCPAEQAQDTRKEKGEHRLKRITGHLEEKNGKWYAAVNHYDAEGKRRVKWHNLDLEAKKGSKKEAAERMQKLLDKINAGEIYLAESMTHAERERNRIANSRVEDYLLEWLDNHRVNITKGTYTDYERYIRNRMIPFFKPMELTVKEVTGDEINAFYQAMLKSGLKGATVQRYHAVLHLAFKSAVKRKIIPTNPVDQADRPKSQQFIGSYYNADEIRQLLEAARGDELYIVIMMAAYYGLRRSEVLGLKWSAIDFVSKQVHVRHKVLDEDGGPEGYDVMKTKSSYRTLPLLPQIEEELLREKKRQEEMRAIMKNAYRKEYEEYICVDALGMLFRPSYVSSHFEVILKRNGLRKIRFHDLRHSVASLLLSNKVPMKMIQDWLGHSDMATTANIYSHIDSTSKLESAATIGRALGGDD